MEIPDQIKIASRKITAFALKSGILTKGPCFKCGDNNSECHHKDYLKPLDIVWACRKHHIQQFHRTPIKKPRPIGQIAEYISVQELGKIQGVSSTTIISWCNRGLVKNAMKLGRRWVIPDSVEMVDCKKGYEEYKDVVIYNRPKIGRPISIKD